MCLASLPICLTTCIENSIENLLTLLKDLQFLRYVLCDYPADLPNLSRYMDFLLASVAWYIHNHPQKILLCSQFYLLCLFATQNNLSEAARFCQAKMH